MSKLLPKLRFDGFSGEWEEKKLIDTADKKIKWSFIGGPFGSNLKASDYVAKGVRVIQLQNIGDATFHNNYEIYTSKNKADELLSNNIYPNEIILSKMGDPVARACIVPDTHSRYVMCSDGIRLVVDEKKFNKYFIYTYINSKIFRELAEQISSGSTRKRIGLGDLKKLPLFVPQSLKEQQKIASCLSSLDNLIEAQNKKVEALKKHKKGLMQQLFPKEGKTVPTLRFDGFSGEWEEAPISKYFKTYSGGTPLTTNKSYYGGNISFIRSAEINKLKTELFLTNEGIENSSAKLVKRGDVLYALYGANSGDVAISKIDGAINQAILCLDSEESSNSFLYYNLTYLKTKIINQYIQGGQGNLSGDIIKSLSVLFPKSQKEQQKIASCLSTLDNIIETQTKKVEVLKKHKKGLMQQMFVSWER